MEGIAWLVLSAHGINKLESPDLHHAMRIGVAWISGEVAVSDDDEVENTNVDIADPRETRLENGGRFPHQFVPFRLPRVHQHAHGSKPYSMIVKLCQVLSYL